MQNLFFKHLTPKSPLHLSTYLQRFFPVFLQPRTLIFSTIPPFLLFLFLFVQAPKCLQHPALYLQSMWDEMIVCICVYVCVHYLCTCVTLCIPSTCMWVGVLFVICPTLHKCCKINPWLNCMVYNSLICLQKH